MDRLAVLWKAVLVMIFSTGACGVITVNIWEFKLFNIVAPKCEVYLARPRIALPKYLGRGHLYHVVVKCIDRKHLNTGNYELTPITNFNCINYFVLIEDFRKNHNIP